MNSPENGFVDLSAVVSMTKMGWKYVMRVVSMKQMLYLKHTSALTAVSLSDRDIYSRG